MKLIINKHLLLVTILVLIAIMYRGCGHNPSKRADYQDVIKKVKSGELIPDSNGIIKLPSSLSKASVNGIVKVKRDEISNRNLLQIFFMTEESRWTYYGYLYCSEPLTKKEMYYSDYFKREVIDFGVELVIKKKIDANWYYVVRLADW